MNFNEVITRHSADTRSILLWINALRYELTNSKTDNEDERLLKQSIENKLQGFESDALSIASYYSDVESSLNDPIVKDDILAGLKA